VVEMTSAVVAQAEVVAMSSVAIVAVVAAAEVAVVERSVAIDAVVVAVVHLVQVPLEDSKLQVLTAIESVRAYLSCVPNTQVVPVTTRSMCHNIPADASAEEVYH